MKKIMFVVLIIFFVSCKELNYPKSFNYSIEMIVNPDKIYNLSENFPDIFVDSIIGDELRDSAYLQNMNYYIRTIFQNNSNDLDYSFFSNQKVDNKIRIQTQQFILQSNNSIKFDEYDEIFEHDFYMNRLGLSFLYLRKDTNYFLVTIVKSGRSSQFD